MAHLFHLTSATQTTRVEPEAAAREDDALHKLIETNPDLLPGDQISPDRRVRWLVIKSEAPVSDPESGEQRWSLDLLLGDQSAWPALVECKRSGNAEIRREMIGQAIEYAANAQFYWDEELIRGYALDRCHGDLQMLESQLKDIGWLESSDEYFTEFDRNLKKGVFRIIFAVDYAPHRLRSTVEFLNREFQDIEALVVELRHYRVGAEHVVTSGVFGYTEEIRRAKRDAAARRDNGPYDEAHFMARIGSLEVEGLAQAVETILAHARLNQWLIRYGRSGDLLLTVPQIDRKTLLGIRLGDAACIEWYPAEHARERPDLADSLRDLAAKVGSTGATGFPRSTTTQWVPKTGQIIDAIEGLIVTKS